MGFLGPLWSTDFRLAIRTHSTPCWLTASKRQAPGPLMHAPRAAPDLEFFTRSSELPLFFPAPTHNTNSKYRVVPYNAVCLRCTLGCLVDEPQLAALEDHSFSTQSMNSILFDSCLRILALSDKDGTRQLKNARWPRLVHHCLDSCVAY